MREFRCWEKTMATKKLCSTKGLSALDDFLQEEGTRETFQAVAIKEVLGPVFS
jgi:hypothetical protein